MELRAFPSISEIEMESIKSFCDAVDIVGLSLPIKETAIEIRRTKNLKLPDAIIAATAIHLDTPFLTADRTFERVENLNLMLYQPGILP
jgi:predicted nucleic acid-binding protein